MEGITMMNKKIKIIELLNKIANGETLPKKIRYERFIWILGKTASKNTDYQMEGNPEQFLFSNYILSILVECLNDEVEILEDNTEDNTEEIEEFEELKPVKDGITYRYEWSEIPSKINELVKAINKLRKEKSNDK
jgi:hypothetical protein